MLNSLKLLGLAIIIAFAPAKAMILTSLALVTADMITGIWAAKIKGEKITSSGLRRSVVKLFIYEVAVLLGFLTQQYLTGDSIPVASIIAGFVGLTELTSCLENLNTISGGDVLKTLIEQIGAFKK